MNTFGWRPLVLGLAISSFTAGAQTTYTVTTTADSGPGSLRQAILDANAKGNTDPVCAGNIIRFSIGSGLKSIRPLSALPILTGASLDGTTQPGYAGTPLIEINGDLLPWNSYLGYESALEFGGGSCRVVVRAIIANRAPGAGFYMGGPATLLSSYAGIDSTGTIARPNRIGVWASGGSRSAIIGGLAPGEGNVISGNLEIGVWAFSNLIVSGNLIGTDRTGGMALPNQTGVQVSNSSTVYENVISGNAGIGIEVFEAYGAVIARNTIGPAAVGDSALGVQGSGVVISYGSGNTISENRIAYHSNQAIVLSGTSVRNRISQNAIYSNGFGIDLGSGGPTPNDPCDVDSGNNLLLNYPVLTGASSSSSRTLVSGTLESAPNATYMVELFSSPSCSATGYGEGKSYLGSVLVTTDSSCRTSFTADLPVGVPRGSVITATSTDSYGDTSEFSACIPAAIATGFYTLPPCRVIDSRGPDGPLGGPALVAGARRDFQLTGSCGIPADALAVAANVTVTAPAAVGRLQLFAGGTPTPATSVVDFRSGQTRANNALLMLGGGAISAVNASTGTANLLVDVVGYFR